MELRRAFRSLARRPAFTAPVTLALALGLGVGTALWAVVEATLLTPLPYDRPEELFIVEVELAGGETEQALTGAGFQELRDRLSLAAELSASMLQLPTDYGTPEALETISAVGVEHTLFETLGVTPELGRPFVAADTLRTDGALGSVMLSHTFWTGRLGADPGVVGRTIPIGGRQRVVVGVMPEEFRLRIGDGSPEGRVDAWWPLAPSDQGVAFNHAAVGRLRPDVTLEQLNAEVRSVGSGIAARYPAAHDGGDARYRAVSLRAVILADTRRPISLLMGAVALLLVATMANVSGLLMARMVDRSGEIAVRKALGAGRRDLVLPVLLESCVLVTFGAIGGSAVASMLVGAVVRAEPPGARTVLPEMDASAVVFIVALSLVMALGASFGAAALQTGALGRVTRPAKASGVIVAFQVALSVVLLTGTALIARTLVNVSRVDVGYDPTGVLAFQLAIDPDRYPAGAASGAFYRRLRDGLTSVAGIDAVGFRSWRGVHAYEWDPSATALTGRFTAEYRWAVPGYFEAIGLPLRSGRTFDDDDERLTRRVVVVDEALATRAWPGEPVVGKKIFVPPTPVDDPEWVEVVGVVGASRSEGPLDEAYAKIYQPYWRRPWTVLDGFARTVGDPSSAASALADAVARERPGRALRSVRPLTDDFGAVVREERRILAVLGVLVVTLLLVTGAGIYGVVASIVRHGRRDSGVRSALGAGRRRLVARTLTSGLHYVWLGVPFGIVLYVPWARVLEGHLFGITALDVPTLVVVACFHVAFAAVAALVPALESARVDPARALRAE